MSTRFALLLMAFATVGLCATLIIRAADSKTVVADVSESTLIVVDETASQSSYISFNETQITQGCDAGFTGNLFHADFTGSSSKTVSRAQMEEIFGAGKFDWWESSNDASMAIIDDYLRLTYKPEARGSNHFGFQVDLGDKGVDEIWWEQQVYPEADWQWGGKSEGGKLNGVSGGTSDRPSGAAPSGGYPPFDGEGFSLRNMWRDSKSAGELGRIVGYTYHIDQAGKYGDDLGFDDEVFIPKEQWSTITHHVKMNSSNKQAKGQGDGVWEMWINGKKVIEYTDLRLSANGNTHTIEDWVFSSFYGGNTINWAPSQPTHMRLRCLKATTVNPF